MQLVKMMALAGISLGLAACGSPTIQVQKSVQPDKEGRTKYYFYASNLDFGRAKAVDKDKDGKPVPGADLPGTIAVSTATVADKSQLYYLKGTSYAEGFGVQTKLKSTRVDGNDELLATIGTEVVDKRSDILAAIGGTLVALAPVLAPANVEIDADLAKPKTKQKVSVAVANLPGSLPMPAFMRDAKIDPAGAAATAMKKGCTAAWPTKPADGDSDEAKKKYAAAIARDNVKGGSVAASFSCNMIYKEATGWEIVDDETKLDGGDLGAVVTLAEASQSAFSRAEFDSTIGPDLPVLPYSSCRTGTIEFKKIKTDNGSSDGVLKLPFRIADPDWVETLGLLYNGTLTLKRPCGGESGDEKGGPTDPFDYAKALLQQIKDVKTAYKPKN